MLAGHRLAAILNKIFMNDAIELSMQGAALKFKNEIDAKDAPKHIGKKVTACGRVYCNKSTR